MTQLLEGQIIDRGGAGELGGDRIIFKYYQPITDSVEAEYDEVGVRGRSEPYVFYTQTGPNTYNFDIRLAASADEADEGSTRRLWSDYLFLKSFQYPDYGPGNVGPVSPPRQVIIRLGTTFRHRGVIKSPSFTLLEPYDELGYPYLIDCQFVFRVINDRPLSFRDIRSGNFRIPENEVP